VPWPFLATYAATKAGVEQGARTLALELEGTGIRATVVRVGNTTGTDWAGEWESADFALAREWQRFGIMRHAGFMQPAEVAEAVVRVLDTPRGVHLDLVSVHPEAPAGTPAAPALGKKTR
jgi:NAD(P)-dependent dehydrogenase (short-subunit alcohol dehydrogenase family)